MLATNHVGTDAAPMAHPVVASVARELLNKSENERSGVVSTALSFLGLYRDPVIAANTARSDWRIADLVGAERPVSLYLVVPPSDLSRTRPLIRLLLNQIARQLTDRQAVTQRPRPRTAALAGRRVPALGRLEFFEILPRLPGGLRRARRPGRPVPQSDRQGLRTPTTPSSTIATCASPSRQMTNARPSGYPIRWARRPNCAP